MKLHAFGDSFVVGDQDDFHEYPIHKMGLDERIEYLKYNVSFVSIIAKSIGCDLINYSERGSGNYPQLDKLYLAITENRIDQQDTVLFGITTPSRDRVALRNFEQATNRDIGESLIDRPLLNNGNFKTICEIDLLYIFSSLTQLSRATGIKIIVFFIFDNALCEASSYVQQLCPTELLLGKEFSGNTLVDILNDTWGFNTNHPYHTQLIIPAGYESLYTSQKHPSIIGHVKIANWWLKNVFN